MKDILTSDEAVKKATGKNWAEWFKILEKTGATKLPHNDIAQKLNKVYNVPGWWSQGITVEFERFIGRRVVGQDYRGQYQTAVSKTMVGSIDDSLAAWQKLVANRTSFDGVDFANEPSVSKTNNWRYWRVNLKDGTKVSVTIGIKDNSKSQLAVAHEKLSSGGDIKRWKTYWKLELGNL